MRSLLAATLTSHLVDDPKPLGAVAWRKLRELVIDAPDPDSLARLVEKRLPADAAAVLARLALLDRMEQLLDTLRNDGVEVLSEFDETYPRRLIQRLGGKHPPLFFVSGSRTLLNADTIGVVGSRDIDDNGKAFARAIADEAVSRNMAIVSGGARGVDLEAMRAAVDAGGATIGFLADSLVTLARRPQMQQFLEDGRICLATSFSPTAGFQVGNAMSRNKYIYAHSQATVVVSSAAGTGGTWAGAVEALDKRLCTVLVRACPAAGNVELARRGATTITAPAELWAQLRENEAPVQGVLF
ncbi:MAG: DNA-processing protein DprA [Armatimonadetes bacterium]|nr:DNA-processing protein DprA [Armatimonadota bacterium]